MPWSETSQGRDAASWATLVVLIACLDWAMKVVLLVRQRRLSRSKAVPVVLTSTVTPDEFRFSAQRFQRIFAAQLGHANLVLNTIVCSLQFNLLPIAWNWAGLLVRPDQPQAAFEQSLVWLALLQLLRSVPRTLMYIDECWRVGLARRPSLAAFFLDRTTVAAILVLGAVRIVGATRLGTWPLQSGTIAMADAVAACVIPTVAFFLNVPLVPLTQTRAPTEAPIATSSLDSDEKHPVHPTELVQLTTDEAEAIRMYERGSKTSMLAQRTVFVLNLVFTVLFVQLVNHNPLFLRAFGFGAAEQGTPAVIDAPPLVVGSALATLLLRPLLVAARLQLNFLSRRAVCAQDRHFAVRCAQMVLEDEVVNDWVDYEASSFATGADLKACLENALLKLYLADDAPLFADPLYNAYFLSYPSLAERFAALGSVSEETGPSREEPAPVRFNKAEFDPYFDESSGDVAVPSLLLQA